MSWIKTRHIDLLPVRLAFSSLSLAHAALSPSLSFSETTHVGGSGPLLSRMGPISQQQTSAQACGDGPNRSEPESAHAYGHAQPSAAAPGQLHPYQARPHVPAALHTAPRASHPSLAAPCAQWVRHAHIIWLAHQQFTRASLDPLNFKLHASPFLS